MTSKQKHDLVKRTRVKKAAEVIAVVECSPVKCSEDRFLEGVGAAGFMACVALGTLFVLVF